VTESVCTFVTGLCYTLLQLIQYLIVGSDYSVFTECAKDSEVLRVLVHCAAVHQDVGGAR